jgi:hypothetical protein
VMLSGWKFFVADTGTNVGPWSRPPIMSPTLGIRQPFPILLEHEGPDGAPSVRREISFIKRALTDEPACLFQNRDGAFAGDLRIAVEKDLQALAGGEVHEKGVDRNARALKARLAAQDVHVARDMRDL